MDYSFLAHVDDALDEGELRERIRRVLRKMELLSEARAMTIGISVHGGEPDHLPPETQKKGMRPDGKPPRERSLFERYLWEFEQCPKRPDPQWAFRLLCACAERDYEHHLKGPGVGGVAGSVHLITEGQSRNGAQVEKERGDELVRDYEGAPAAEVAMITQQREAWVRKARELRGRHPDTGLPKPGWAGWTDEQRFRRVQTLKARTIKGKAVSQQWVAAELGTSRSAIQRYWQRRPDERAA